MSTEFAIKPKFELSVSGKNVTQDVSEFLSSLEYVDRLEDASGEIQIELNDIAGLWSSEWYIEPQTTLELKIGYDGNLLDCGLFEVDEIESNSPPDIMIVKALAVSISKDLRTRKSRAFENQTLRSIAQKIADEHGLELVGDLSRMSQIEISRKTQHHESNLAFLANLARRFGMIFSVRDNQLVFLNPEELERKPAIATINKSEVSKHNFKDKTANTFEEVEIARRDVRSNRVVSWRIENSNDPTKKDTMHLGGRAENEGQAAAIVTGSIRSVNKTKMVGSFRVDGNPLLVAGVNVDLNEFGAFSGLWTISKSIHKIDRDGGYTTEVSLIKGMRSKTIQPPTRTAANRNQNQRHWGRDMGYNPNR